MNRKLTERQRRFVDNYCDSGNGADAARKAGYSEKSARITASKHLLANANIRAAICERLNKGGVTQDRLIKKLDEGLDAMITKIASHEGAISDTREFIDYGTRCKYLEIGLKLHDMFPAERHEHSVNPYENWTDEQIEHFIKTGEYPID